MQWHSLSSLDMGSDQIHVTIGKSNLEILEKLLGAYAEITSAMPRVERLGKSFTESPSIRYIISVIYADILEFHRRAYKFFRRRGWRNFFHSSWASFGIRFKTIIDSLVKHSDPLDREANSIDITEAKEWRRKVTEDATVREEERANAQFQDALAWLAIDDQEEQLDQLSDRCQAGTCDWLFVQKDIIAWTDDGPGNSLLWLKGIPGSGKSVLCSQLIQRLRQDDKSTVAYYICDSYTSDQIKCAQILKAITAQILRAHRDMAAYITGEFVSRGFTPSVPKLRKLLENMPRCSTRIVVDGLDEIADKEHRQIINELRNLVKAKEPCCKVLISSREGGDISKLLKLTSVFSLSDYPIEIHNAITSFVAHEVKILQTRFDNGTLDAISQELIRKAGGMFLWVRLVLTTLDDVYNLQELFQAVKSLPEGLYGAYGRVVDGFKNRLSKSNQDKATRLLQWIAFACRPLRMHELLDGTTLHLGSETLDETSRLDPSVLELCKPIIEEGPGKTIQFVHFSAKEFLIHKLSGPFLLAASAHHTIALSCTMYLSDSFITFHPSISDTEMLLRLINRYHSLQSYAHEFWVYHTVCYLQAERPFGPETLQFERSMLINQLRKIMQAQKEVGEAQEKSSNKDVNATRESENSLKVLVPLPELFELMRRMIGFRMMVMDSYESHDTILAQRPYEVENDPTRYSEIMHRYRDSVESLLTTPEEDMLTASDAGAIKRFKELHGAHPFPCRYLRCKRNIETFESVSERDRHEATHYRRWKCGDNNCPFYATGWKSARALKQHNQACHTDYAAFPSFGDDNADGGSLIEAEADQSFAPQAKTSGSSRKFRCQGTLISGDKWGCERDFASAAELTAHFRTPMGFACIKGLYSGSKTSLECKDLQEPEREYMFTSSCGGSLNSNGKWGCGRNFPSDQALHQHWQTSIGARCRQPLIDESEARIADWGSRTAANSSLFESPALHTWIAPMRKEQRLHQGELVQLDRLTQKSLEDELWWEEWQANEARLKLLNQEADVQDKKNAIQRPGYLSMRRTAQKKRYEHLVSTNRLIETSRKRRRSLETDEKDLDSGFNLKDCLSAKRKSDWEEGPISREQAKSNPDLKLLPYNFQGADEFQVGDEVPELVWALENVQSARMEAEMEGV